MGINKSEKRPYRRKVKNQEPELETEFDPRLLFDSERDRQFKSEMWARNRQHAVELVLAFLPQLGADFEEQVKRKEIRDSPQLFARESNADLHTLMRNAFQNGDVDGVVLCLRQILDTGQYSQNFLFKILSTLFELNHTPDMQQSLKQLFITQLKNCHCLHPDELSLFQLIHAMNTDYSEASFDQFSDNSPKNGKGHQQPRPHQVAATDLYKGYIALINLAKSIRKRDVSTFKNGVSTFQSEIGSIYKAGNKKVINDNSNGLVDNMDEDSYETGDETIFTPFFAPFFETYCNVLLMEQDQTRKTYAFINNHVEREAPLSGVVAPIQALALLTNCTKLRNEGSRNSKKIALIEHLAKEEPSNPLVLDLCQHHLKRYQSTKSETHLLKALKFIVEFLDVRADDAQAWRLMRQIVIEICRSANENCYRAMFDCWHCDRRFWWPMRSFSAPLHAIPVQDGAHEAADKTPGVPVQDETAAVARDYLLSRVVVCAVLEGPCHEFVLNSGANFKQDIDDCILVSKSYAVYAEERINIWPNQAWQTVADVQPPIIIEVDQVESVIKSEANFYGSSKREASEAQKLIDAIIDSTKKRRQTKSGKKENKNPRLRGNTFRRAFGDRVKSRGDRSRNNEHAVSGASVRVKEEPLDDEGAVQVVQKRRRGRPPKNKTPPNESQQVDPVPAKKARLS